MNQSPTTLKIQIVSDVVCPWCIIGYEQLQKALAELPEVKAEITWHAFEINPSLAEGGQNLREHIKEKYGSTDAQSQAARERLNQLGEELGFEFNYTDDMRMYNSFLAHQLLHWSKEQSKQTELKLKLFSAYFTRNEPIDQIEVLVNVAESVGLDPREARLVLEDGRYAEDVHKEERMWQLEGVTGVPAMVLGDKYLVTGARPPEELLPILKEFSLRKTTAI